MQKFVVQSVLRRSFSTVGVGTPQNPYDVLIVGGGITGTALLYTLAAFTDLKRVGLYERRDALCQVASHFRNNSQTIHCGDIETNYTVEKAAKVKVMADMLRNFACTLSPEIRDKCVREMPKMALAVGPEECEFMSQRYKDFKPVFKNIQLIDKKQIAQIEPRVAMKNSHAMREESLVAIYADQEHSAVDYYATAMAFVDQARQHAAVRKSELDVRMKTEVKRISREPDGMFKIISSAGIVYTKYLVSSACGHSLLLAQRLGFALEYSCLPVAGSFYFSKTPVLNGKVYTVQNPALPFAAVHGDNDMLTDGMTRFGPTALPLPLLERYNLSTFKDFLEVLNLDANLVQVYWTLFKNSTIRNYLIKNFLFEVPYLNRQLFASDVQKIVPSLKAEDLCYANGYGGVRPQLVDKIKKKLILGEGRITPEGVPAVFNVTPSPGGTTCLGTAELDTKRICSFLGSKFNEELFKKTLLSGPYK